jgi:hypothetical protein
MKKILSCLMAVACATGGSLTFGMDFPEEYEQETSPQAEVRSSNNISGRVLDFVQNKMPDTLKHAVLYYIIDRGHAAAHELGHASVALAYGSKVQEIYVSPYLFGRAYTARTDNFTPIRDLQVSAAGPLCGIAFALASMALLRAYYSPTQVLKKYPISRYLSWNSLEQLFYRLLYSLPVRFIASELIFNLIVPLGNNDASQIYEALAQMKH